MRQDKQKYLTIFFICGCQDFCFVIASSSSSARPLLTVLLVSPLLAVIIPHVIIPHDVLVADPGAGPSLHHQHGAGEMCLESEDTFHAHKMISPDDK